MAEAKLTKLVLENFIASAEGVVGSDTFRHIYVRDADGREFDAADDGRLSCAYVVSGLLTMYGLIDSPHATVAKTLAKMQEHGWEEVDRPCPGAIAYWPSYNGNEHIGIAVGGDEFVSNSSDLRVPVRHGLTLSNGVKATKFYAHPQLHEK